MYIKPLKIGNVKLENNIILAPMAGVTDLPFRMICKKYGDPGLVCTEMASSRAIFYNDEKTKKLLNTEGEKKPISIQIFGNSPDIMSKAAKKVEGIADIIDINMGCPAPKVVKNGDGSKLLLNLDLAGDIVKSVVESVNKPVTVKIRKGWDAKNIVVVEAAKVIEKAGASAITVHGRTREEYYSGRVDLESIKKVKEAVDIPVIGNGDIKTPEDAKNMFEKTNVDGIMVGRATIRKSLDIERDTRLFALTYSIRTTSQCYQRTSRSSNHRKRRICCNKRNEKAYMLVYKKLKRFK